MISRNLARPAKEENLSLVETQSDNQNMSLPELRKLLCFWSTNAEEIIGLQSVGKKKRKRQTVCGKKHEKEIESEFCVEKNLCYRKVKDQRGTEWEQIVILLGFKITELNVCRECTRSFSCDRN